MREACCDSPGRDQSGIVQLPRAEEDFVGGIILLKKSREMRLQIRLRPMQRLQQAYGGSNTGLESTSLRRTNRRTASIASTV